MVASGLRGGKWQRRRWVEGSRVPRPHPKYRKRVKLKTQVHSHYSPHVFFWTQPCWPHQIRLCQSHRWYIHVAQTNGQGPRPHFTWPKGVIDPLSSLPSRTPHSPHFPPASVLPSQCPFLVVLLLHDMSLLQPYMFPRAPGFFALTLSLIYLPLFPWWSSRTSALNFCLSSRMSNMRRCLKFNMAQTKLPITSPAPSCSLPANLIFLRSYSCLKMTIFSHIPHLILANPFSSIFKTFLDFTHFSPPLSATVTLIQQLLAWFPASL